MGRGGDGAGAELCGAYKRRAGSRSGAHVRTGENVRGRTPPVREREAALTGLLRAAPWASLLPLWPPRGPEVRVCGLEAWPGSDQQVLTSGSAWSW